MIRRHLSIFNSNNWPTWVKLFTKFSLFLPLLAITITINCSIDPANIFKNTYFYSNAVKKLLQGYNLTNITNFDERIFHKIYIENNLRTPDVIILGSSRSMSIDKTNFPNNTFFNHSVSGGTIEDYLALFNLYEEKLELPKIVVICADPWIFNGNSGLNHWKTLKDDYERMINTLSSDKTVSHIPWRLSDFISEKKQQLISFEYFQKSFKKLRTQKWKMISNNFSLQPTKIFLNNSTTLLTDGSRTYDEITRKRVHFGYSGIKVDALIFTEQITYLNHYFELNKRRLALFESFVNHLKNKNIRVVLFLGPYHPKAYKTIKKLNDYKMVLEAEKYFDNLAQDKNLTIVGSYNPLEVGVNHTRGFMDRMHFDASIVKKIFKHSQLKSENSLSVTKEKP